MFLGQGSIEEEIRTEIEQHITQRERISTSVEMPLTTECKEALNLAAEETQRLRHRHIGTEHVLLGMLGVEGSLAARLLQAKGLTAAAVREQVSGDFRSTVSVKEQDAPGEVRLFTDARLRDDGSKSTLQNFLVGLKNLESEDLIEFFAQNAQFIDASGRRDPRRNFPEL